MTDDPKQCDVDAGTQSLGPRRTLAAMNSGAETCSVMPIKTNATNPESTFLDSPLSV
jgi:hypothetical protein